MKTWNQYFGANKVNEDHKETKEEQAKWICDIVNKMKDEEVKKIYDYIEKEFDYE